MIIFFIFQGKGENFINNLISVSAAREIKLFHTNLK
jgi:hypothetical protein